MCRWKRITKNQMDASSNILKQKKSRYSFDKEVYSKQFSRPRLEYILEPRISPHDRQLCKSISSKCSVPFDLHITIF